MRKIAVEQNLSPVADYLERQGYSVKKMNAGDMLSGKNSGFDAFVISGASENFLGMEDRTTKASVINADGSTPEDVYLKLENMLTRAGT